MNKIILTFLFVIGMLAFAQNVQAGSRYDAHSWIEAPASSGTVGGGKIHKACAVLSIWASSDTETAGNWFQLVDTVPVPNTTYGMFSASDHKSPALFFPSTATTVSINWNHPMNKVADYGADGINFSTAPYVHKTAATSGQARRVWLEIVQ